MNAQSEQKLSGETPLLEARQLGRQLRSGRWLLRHISLVVSSGDRVALVGPTGAGKTLLLRLLSQLDPCSEGALLWNGRMVAAQDAPAFRSQVMYVHQRPTIAGATISDVLRQPFAFRVHHTKKWDELRIGPILSRLDRSASLLDQDPSDLSGGERQIVALTRALLLSPAVLLLDEPTSALDKSSAQRVEQLLMDWVGEAHGRAYLWVSHDQQQVQRVTDRIVRLRNGELEEH